MNNNNYNNINKQNANATITPKHVTNNTSQQNQINNLTKITSSYINKIPTINN